MDVHELKDLDFDEAIDLLESRLVDIREMIAKGEGRLTSADVKQLKSSRTEAAERVEKLRKMKAAEMAGERDNLLNEAMTILDQIGQRISSLFPEGKTKD